MKLLCVERRCPDNSDPQVQGLAYKHEQEMHALRISRDDAQNLITFFPGQTTKPYKGYKSGRQIEFDNSDLEDIKKNFPMFLEYVTPRINRNALTKYKNESNNYSVRAVAPSHQYAEKTIMMKGRYLNSMDIKRKTKNAVIGRLVEIDLFGKEDGLGKYIDVGGSVFKVIGALPQFIRGLRELTRHFQRNGGGNCAPEPPFHTRLRPG